MKTLRAAKIHLLLLARWNRHLIQDSGHRNPMKAPQLQRRMAGWIHQKRYQVLLFETGRVPVGYVLFRREKDHVYIRQFFIDRKYRRKGMGREAMKLFFKEITPEGKRVVLDVLVGNRSAICFWKSVGFKPYCLTMER